MAFGISQVNALQSTDDEAGALTPFQVKVRQYPTKTNKRSNT
jgi:hypothetical protein